MTDYKSVIHAKWIKIQNLNQEIGRLIAEAIDNASPPIKYTSYPPYGISEPKEEILTSNDVMFLSPGDWDCEKSPIGYCLYHNVEDEYHDHCIICGQPEERK